MKTVKNLASEHCLDAFEVAKCLDSIAPLDGAKWRIKGELDEELELKVLSYIHSSISAVVCPKEDLAVQDLVEEVNELEQLYNSPSSPKTQIKFHDIARAEGTLEAVEELQAYTTAKKEIWDEYYKSEVADIEVRAEIVEQRFNKLYQDMRVSSNATNKHYVDLTERVALSESKVNNLEDKIKKAKEGFLKSFFIR